MQPHRPILSLPSRFARAACTLALCLALTVTARADEEPVLGAFSSLRTIPDVVDAAAVFENPADELLLSPVGRSMRTMLSFAGVFTHTEHAWQALADAFKAPKDDTIRALLSKRVTVVWDGFERADPNMQGLTDSIDTRWALICEVEPDYLNNIRQSLRPVKRDIVSNRPVYAIEQGRYRVVLIDASAPGEPATVMLSPRSGAELLNSVLAHIDARPAPETITITQNRERMLAEVAAQHNAQAETAWTFAFIARMDIFRLLAPNPAPADASTNHVLAGIVRLNQSDLTSTFGTDSPIEDNLRDAPIALYDAIASDSVLAVASSKSPSMFISPNEMSLSVGISADENSDRRDPILDAPFLMSLSEGDSMDMRLNVALMHERRNQGETARMLDDAINSFVSAYDPSQAPDFAGSIPRAIRQVEIQKSEQSHASDDATSSWPGTRPQIAWTTSSTQSHDIAIASIAPEPIDTSGQVRSIATAAHAIEAAGPRPASGVLLRARIKPAEAMRIIDDPSIADLALARLVRQLDVELRRGIHAPMRGTLRIRFSDHASKPKLGSDK